MNILVITQLYPQPDDTGDNKPTRTVEYFAKEWVTSGNKVVIMHCPSKFPLVFYYVPATLKNKLGGSSSNIIPPVESRKVLYREEFGIQVHRLPMLKLMPGMGYSTKRIEKQAHTIASELEKKQFIPDLVVGHFANPSTGLVAVLAEKYGAKSSIVFHHDCNERNLKKYQLDKWIQNIGAVGARSIIEANKVKDTLSLNTTPFICCSGVPNDAVEAAEKTCSKMDFQDGIKHIYVGSFIKRKHLDATIKAFINSKNECDTLKVIGGGPEEDSLKTLATELCKDGSVIFTGRISRSEVLKQMKEAQVFTLVSDGETYGMVYIEAMLQGCFVIASKGGGFDGIIVDGVNGFICKPGDEEMLENIYRRIQGMSKEERNRIGQNAIDTAIHFSEKEVAERYLSDVLKSQK